MLRNLILLVIGFNLQAAFSQVMVSEDLAQEFNSLPAEYAYAHVNNSLFLTGEYLYYSIYCINSNNNQLSDISKVAYVVLVRNKDVVFQHKVKLRKGVGSGDHFIPVTVPSGSYKLIAYTQWMQNGPMADFFQTDIHIINPYQADQSGVVRSNIGNDTVQKSETLFATMPNKEKTGISLHLSDSTFKKRSQVKMVLKTTSDSLKGSAYSVSVHKKNEMASPWLPDIGDHLGKKKSHGYSLNNRAPKSIYLPELRGELFSGAISSTDKKSSVSDLSIAISIPGENPYFNIVKTDKNGHFFFNIEDYYSENEAYLAVLDDNKAYEILLHSNATPDYSKLRYSDMVISLEDNPKILKRSISNQIENSYFKFKPDSIMAIPSAPSFESSVRKSYYLDDFARFKTVRETFFEVVKDVVIRRINKNKSVVRVKGYHFGTNSLALPIILLDGIMVQDPNALLEMEAKSIHSISILRDQFVIGPEIFQGAILLNSIDSQVDNYSKLGYPATYKLFKSNDPKKYFKQAYLNNDPKNIPDDRYQLYWNPAVIAESDMVLIDFYTSDVPGDFEITIQGITKTGEPISIHKSISVK